MDTVETIENGYIHDGRMDAEKLPESFEEEALTGDGAEKKVKKRETWTKPLDFLVACCGFSIGLGNVWKFPFLCYRNGGGAFLIPYFVCCLIGGIPTFFLEVSIGQFMSRAGMNAWKIVPLFQGIGVAMVIVIFETNCDYNVLLSYAIYYLFASMTTELPWSHCRNEWNTGSCSETNWKGMTVNVTSDGVMTSKAVTNYTLQTAKSYVSDPVTEFWERKVLAISDGVDVPGNLKWDLCLCLLLAWLLVYFCIWKGIKGSSKIMYFTVTSPYILMFILLIRGLTLEGSGDGIKFYLLPDFSRLLDVQVWADAGNQVFYSYSLSSGILIALGSYNKFHHNSFRDCVMFAFMNSFTSLLCGFVIFSVLGFMANKQGVSVADVAESGPGLAFIAYPEAVAQMPIAPMWSIIFFLMLILVGLDSQFVGVEGMIAFVIDLYPRTFRVGYRREILIAVVCAVSFLVGLSMVCEGGMYVFQLFDYFSVSRTIFAIAFIEMIVISYVYGINRHYGNLELMYGFKVFRFIKFCWAILTPLFILGLFIVGILSYDKLTYDRKSVSYEFPDWSIAIGWLMAIVSIIWIPIVAVYQLWKAKGTFKERLEYTLKPVLRMHQVGPHEDVNKVTLVDYDDDFKKPDF